MSEKVYGFIGELVTYFLFIVIGFYYGHALTYHFMKEDCPQQHQEQTNE